MTATMNEKTANERLNKLDVSELCAATVRAFS